MKNFTALLLFHFLIFSIQLQANENPSSLNSCIQQIKISGNEAIPMPKVRTEKAVLDSLMSFKERIETGLPPRILAQRLERYKESIQSIHAKCFALNTNINDMIKEIESILNNFDNHRVKYNQNSRIRPTEKEDGVK